MALSKGIGICSVVEPNTLSDVVPIGNYFFYLSICADNIRPTFAKLSVNYDGGWSGNIQTMFGNHLKVKLLKYGVDKKAIFD